MRKLIFILAVLALLAAACGDDSVSLGDLAAQAEQSGEEPSSESGDSGASSSSDDDSAGDESGSDDDSAGDESGSDDDSAGDESGSDDGGGESASGAGGDFCGFNTEINNGLDEIDIFSGDASAIGRAFDEILDRIEDATSLVPSEIEEDVEILAEGVREFREVLEDYDYNLFAIPEDEPRLLAIDDPRYEEAADRVNAFCGFDDEEVSTTDTPDESEIPGGGEIDMDFIVQLYQEIFGWDEDLARCIVEELGLEDPAAGVDPSAFADPSAEICGRSFTELFSGG